MKAKVLLDLKKRKNNIILLLLSIIILYSTPLYNKFTENYINESLKTTAATYAISRSINAIISVIKHSSIEIGAFIDTNLAIGEVVDPIDDAIERFSTLTTNSIWIIGSEKIIYELSKMKIFTILILFLAFVNIFINNSILKKLILILLFLRIYMPISALTFHYLDQHYFKPQTQKYVKIIKYTATNTQVNHSFENIKEKIKKYQQIFYYYKANANTIILSLLSLASIFLTKLLIIIVIIPFLFLFTIQKLRL